MENIDKTAKYKKQDEFWQGIIQKYEDRNIALEQEQLALQERVDQMEAAMPAVVAFNMTKLAQQKPDAPVNNLVPMDCHCMDVQPPKTPLEIPDLTNISVFSIEDADVHYMDKIKELAGQEKALIDDVNRLRSKEKALKGTKQTMDDIMDTPAYKKGSVDADELQRMNERLIDDNRRLSDDVADLKLELKHTRETIEGPMTRELERERRKVMQLENELKGKTDENSQKNNEVQREINFLKNQLEGADKNLADMIEINNKLKDELDILNIRAQELQNDLINQKISEANTLALLKNELNKKGQDPYGGRGPPGSGEGGGTGSDDKGPKPPPSGDGPKTSSSKDGSCGSLYKIARDLSNDLVETKDDTTIPDDLKGTVEEIKDLCDLIDQKFCSKNKLDDGIETTPVKDDSAKSVSKQSSAGTVVHVPPIKSTSTVPPSQVAVVSNIKIEPSKQGVTPKPSESKAISKISVKPSKPEVPTISEISVKPSKPEVPTISEISVKPDSEQPQVTVEESPKEPSVILEEPVLESSKGELMSTENLASEDQSIAEESTEAEPIIEAEHVEPIESQPPIDEVVEPPVLRKHVDDLYDNQSEKNVCPFKEQCIAKVKKYEEEKKAREYAKELARDHASLIGPGKTKSSCKKPERTDSEYVEEIEIITELEATGETDVETDVKVIKKTNDGFNVTTTVTRSGTLEVTTEGPAGLIETTMTVTDSGNIEVITEFTESMDKGLAGQVQDFRQGTDFGDPGGKSEEPGSKDSGYEADNEVSKPSDDRPLSSSKETHDNIEEMKETASVSSKTRRSSSILKTKSQDLAAIYEEPIEDYIPSRGTEDKSEFLPQKDTRVSDSTAESIDKLINAVDEPYIKKDDGGILQACDTEQIILKQDIIEKTESRKSTIEDYKSPLIVEHKSETDEEAVASDETTHYPVHKSESSISVIKDDKIPSVSEHKSESMVSHEDDNDHIIGIKPTESLLSVFDEEEAQSEKESADTEEFYSALDIQAQDMPDERLLTSIPEDEGEEELELEYSDESSQEEEANLIEDGEVEKILDHLPDDQLDELRAHSILQGILQTIHSELSEIRKSTTSSSLKSEETKSPSPSDHIDQTPELLLADFEMEGSTIEGLQMGVEVEEYDIDEEFVGEYELGQEPDEEEIIQEYAIEEDEDIPVEKDMVSEGVEIDVERETDAELFDELLEEPDLISVDIEEELTLEKDVEIIAEKEEEIESEKEDASTMEKEEESTIEKEDDEDKILEPRAVLIDAEIGTDAERCICEDKEKMNEAILDAIELANKNIKDFLEKAEKEMGNRLDEMLKEHEKNMAIEADNNDMQNIVLGMVDDVFWRVSFEDRVEKSEPILAHEISKELPESDGDQLRGESINLSKESRSSLGTKEVDDIENVLQASLSELEPQEDEEELKEEEEEEEDYELEEEEKQEEEEQKQEDVESDEAGKSVGETENVELDKIEEFDEDEENIGEEESEDLNANEVIESDKYLKELKKKSISELTDKASKTETEDPKESVGEKGYLSSTTDESSKRSGKDLEEGGIKSSEISKRGSKASIMSGHETAKDTDISQISSSRGEITNTYDITTEEDSDYKTVSEKQYNESKSYLEAKSSYEYQMPADIKDGTESTLRTQKDSNGSDDNKANYRSAEKSDTDEKSSSDSDKKDYESALRTQTDASSIEEIKTKYKAGDKSDTDEKSTSDDTSAGVNKRSEEIRKQSIPETILDNKSSETNMGETNVTIESESSMDASVIPTITVTKESDSKRVSTRSSRSSLIPVVIRRSLQSQRKNDMSKTNTAGSKIPVRMSKTSSISETCSCTSNFVCKDCNLKKMTKSKDSIDVVKDADTCCKECECDLLPPCLPECAKLVIETATDMQGDQPPTVSEVEVLEAVVAIDNDMEEYEKIQEVTTDVNLPQEQAQLGKDKASEIVESLVMSKEESFVEGCQCYLKGNEPSGEKPDAETVRKGCCCYVEEPNENLPINEQENVTSQSKTNADDSIVSEIVLSDKATLTSKLECVCDNEVKKATIGDNIKEMITEELTPDEQDTEEVQELRKLVKQIRCACKKAETLSGPGFTKKASDFKTTLSSLQVALDMFQEKCRTKDVLIDAMKEELKLRARSKIFDDLLKRLNDPNQDVADYNRTILADSLPKPSKQVATFGREAPICICEESESTPNECKCVVNSDPLIITDIKRVGATSIMVNWDPSSDKSVIGYEIWINNVVKARMLSPKRTSAILDLLDLRKSINVRIYAISNAGRCYPAATALYEM